MKWFVWKDGRRWGPMWQRDLRALIQSGEVTAAHVARREDSTTWTPVGRIPELAGAMRTANGGGTDNQAGPGAFPQELSGDTQADPVTPSEGADSLEHPSETQTADSLRDDEPVEDGPYIVRHWRGDLTLPVTYWVNGALLSLVTTAFVVALVWAVDVTRAPRAWSMALTVVWMAVVGMALWQVAGVWRSAGKHVSRGGRLAWAVAARVAVIVGCLQMAFIVASQAVPQLIEFAKVIAGRDPISGYRVRLLRDDSEMEVSGYIAFGLTDRVASILDSHPGVVVIHLNTGGGRVIEARRLRDLIAARHLSTYTSSECASACVIPFLAGDRRLVAPDARVGFHQYTFGGRASAQTVADMETDKEYFLARGVSRAFVERAFRPTSDLWYPTQDQMLEAGYITGRAGSDEVALSGIPPNEIENLEAKLRDDPLYAAIADKDPEVYRRIAAAVRAGFQQGRSLGELRGRIGPLVQEVYRKRLPFASDAAVVDFARLMVDQLDVLQSEPDKCLAFMSPGGGAGVDFRSLFGRDLMQREQVVMADVIRSADGTWRPPRESEVSAVRAEVFSRLMGTWSAADLEQMSHLDRPGIDPARACRVCRDFYKTIADMPGDRAGSMLRYTFAGER